MLSVVIITNNEEERIKACLESIKWVDEIIVADCDSTDDTVRISKEYTKNVFTCKGNDFSSWRNEAMERANGDWVLYIDADERVLEQLREEIKEILQNTTKSAFAIPRKNIIFGSEVNYGPYKHDYMIRIFKKDKFKGWVGEVHEHGNFEGELGYIKNPLLHLTHRDLDHVVLKSLSWSKLDAKLRQEANHPQMSGWRFLRILVTELFNQGIKRRGFFSGTVGMMDALLQTFSTVLSYIRLWEFQQKKSLSETYKDIDQKLIQNKFKFP